MIKYRMRDKLENHMRQFFNCAFAPAMAGRGVNVMKRRMIPVLVAVVLIVLILAGAVGVFLYEKYSYSKEPADLAAYYGLSGREDVAVVLNHAIAQEKGILYEGRCYLDLDTVHAYLNDRFYVDFKENRLLYTLPEGVVETAVGEAVEDDYIAALERSGKVYLALDYVKKYSDFNFLLYTEPNRVLLRTVWEEEQVAELTKDVAVRVRGGVKSEILSKRTKGDRVTVLEEMENWNCVQTADGYIGYVEKKHLTDAVPEMPVKDTGYTAQEYAGNKRDFKINLAWHQVTRKEANATFPGVMDGVVGVNVISPTWLFLFDNEGTVESIADADYVRQAHEKGLEVWALVDDFTHRSDNGVNPEEILCYTSKRRKIVDTLMAEAERCGFDGINVDFERVTEKVGEDYIQFIRELSLACHSRGLVLSVDNYVPRAFNSHYEWKEEGIMADYVIVMGYDEHWAGCKEAGSVASLGYVEEGIQKMVQEVPSDKVINALPLYTRIWATDSAGEVTSQAVGIQEASDYLLRRNVPYVWDEATGQNYAEFEAEGSLVQVWLEDEQSIGAKVSVMKNYGLGGVAAWKLGFDEGRKNIWSVIAGFFAE